MGFTPIISIKGHDVLYIHVAIRDLHLPTNVGSGPEREFAVNSQECWVFFSIVIAFLGNVEPSFYPRKGLQFEDLMTYSLTAMPT